MDGRRRLNGHLTTPGSSRSAPPRCSRAAGSRRSTAERRSSRRSSARRSRS